MNMQTIHASKDWLGRVAEVGVSFWIIKIMATTVGETGADFLAVNVGWGQRVTRAVTGELLAVALSMPLSTHRYTPWVYWLTVVLVSVVGTQIPGLLTDGLGSILYASNSVFALVLAAIFAVWYWAEGRRRAIDSRHRDTQTRAFLLACCPSHICPWHSCRGPSDRSLGLRLRLRLRMGRCHLQRPGCIVICILASERQSCADLLDRLCPHTPFRRRAGRLSDAGPNLWWPRHGHHVDQRFVFSGHRDAGGFGPVQRQWRYPIQITQQP